MAESGEAGSPRPYNVLAAFRDGDQAATAVGRLTTSGIPASTIVHHKPSEAGGDQTGALRAEMQEELAESWLGPAGLAMTPSQAKGAFLGTVGAGVVGAVVGLAVGVAWAYAADSTLSRPARVALCVFLGLLGGGTVGFLVGGIQKGYDQGLAGEHDHLVAIHAEKPEVAERAAAILREVGAERVDLVDGSQTPLPPQARHPRPADPRGWWWRRAGHG